MKKKPFILMLAVLMMLTLSACANSGSGSGSDSGSSENAEPVETNVPVKEMVDKMLEAVEQPAFMELDDEMLKQQYYLDPALLEEYSARMPMMNVKSNEISVFKVKDEKDIPAVEEGIKKRAADAQKSFEQYLPDQYENAKNYKIVTKGKYVLFVISEEADALVKSFENFFAQK